MARTAKRIQQSEIQGLKYFSMLDELLKKLSHVGTQRDKAGNRELFCDQYVSLLLLYFFSPVITSMRALQEASELEKVQKVLGVKRVSLGSFCEAPTVFDPEPVHDIIRELAQRAVPLVSGREADALKNLTAVDGSVFQAVTKASWALWLDPQHRAAG